nr:unnamed protein product [Callosobruchus chinensis]
MKTLNGLLKKGDVILTPEEIAETIKNTHNWPGIDNVQNFWHKQFGTIYEMLTDQINKDIRQPDRLPKFLTQGKTQGKCQNYFLEPQADYFGSEDSVLMSNQALPRSHSFKLLGVSITESMIWHEHVSSIATAAGKKLGYLFRARKYFSPSNLLTLYKAQIRPSLEYCSHI